MISGGCTLALAHEVLPVADEGQLLGLGDLIFFGDFGRKDVLHSMEVFIRAEPFNDEVEVKLDKRHIYTVHEVMADAVEVLQELSSFRLRHAVPYFLEDELMPIRDDSAH